MQFRKPVASVNYQEKSQARETMAVQVTPRYAGEELEFKIHTGTANTLMNDDVPNKLDARVAELESLFSHSQRLIEQLDEIVREQETRLAAQQRRIDQLHYQINRMTVSAAERRTLEDDRPPHY